MRRAAVVRTRFKNEIRAQTLQELVPDAVNEAISKHELNTLGEPDVQLDNTEALEKFGEEPIVVKVNVEVLPKVELQKYKGHRSGSQNSIGNRRKRGRDDRGVARNVRQPCSRLKTGALRLAIRLQLMSRGKFVDDSEEEDIKADDVEVILGGKGVQPEFTDNLTGVKPDDEKTFVVDYPEDFSSKGLAGKKVEYTAKVTAVRVKELPEIDDEWARSLGEDFDSVATLRTKIRENMEKQAGQEADHRLRADLMHKLLEAHPV